MNTQLELIAQLDAAIVESSQQQDRELTETPKETILQFFEHLQGFVWIRRAVTGLFILCILAFMGYFVWNLLPRYYTLRISGGDILSNRHYLVTMLHNEAEKFGLNLVIRPITGTRENLQAINERDVDVALVEGGVYLPFENVRQVAKVRPEVVHLLVRENIQTLADLKRKRINLGTDGTGTQFVGYHFLSFSELHAGEDYEETTYSAERLFSLSRKKMPDAVVTISSTPSFVAEKLVRDYGYHLLEIPFPEALAMRYGWVTDAAILPYTYKTQPPIPEKNITTLGVSMFMMAHKDVPEKAVEKLLDVLYSTGIRTIMRYEFTPDAMTEPSGYPLSAGTESFLRRHDPLLSKENLDKAKGYGGLLMGALTILTMVAGWLKGRSSGRHKIQEEFKRYIALVSRFNEIFPALLRNGEDDSLLDTLAGKLTQLRAAVLQRDIAMKLLDPSLIKTLMFCFETADGYITCRVRTLPSDHATGIDDPKMPMQPEIFSQK